MLQKIALFFVFIISAFSATSQTREDFIRMIENEDFTNFKEEIKKIDNLNKPFNDGFSLLCYAVMLEKKKFVEHLLKNGADINQQCWKKTPLMYATKKKTQIDILKFLISKGADVNIEIDGATAFYYAIKNNNQMAIDTLRLLNKKQLKLRGADGPYLTKNKDKIIQLNVDTTNQLVITTLSEFPEKIRVHTPDNKFFDVRLCELKDEKKCVFKKSKKIFVISDIEGNYYDFVKTLKNNKIINDKFEWTFGKGDLVLVGDFVDRGKDVTPVLWLIYKLESEAQFQGGKVHFILGNHEVMLMQGDVRYAHANYQILSYRTGIPIQDFYAPNTFLGAWFRTKNVVEKIGDYLFVHAGISDYVKNMNLSLKEINHIVRKNIDTPDSTLSSKASLLMNSYGPLWFRNYVTSYRDKPKITMEKLDEILAHYNAKHVVVGHCVVKDISSDYEGKVIRIDVNHYKTKSAGILINKKQIYKMSEDGEKELLFSLP